jgi:transcriptional regulator with XRE-family HTH domain
MFVRQWRVHRGMTQQQLAARLSMSAASISRIESGKLNYTKLRLEAIAAALDCTPASLLASAPTSVDGMIWKAVRKIPVHRRPLALQLLIAVAAAVDKIDL